MLMGNVNPSPSQLLAALKDHGCDITCYRGWDTVGRSWGAYGGLQGVMNHHTATASATGDKGAPSLYWAVTAYDRPVCNMLIGRGKGDTYLLAAGSAYHSGLGGPWPAIGIHSAGNTAHVKVFGIEIDDPGTRVGSMTDYQVEQTARTNAALMDLCGWGPDRIVTHQAWTDGSYGVNPKGPGPYLGRKGDTLHARWREWPGSTKAEAYNPIFWREEAEKYSESAQVWDGTVPTMGAVLRAQDQGLANLAAWRVAARLFDVGSRRDRPAEKGRQKYPALAVKRFQAAEGLSPADGVWTRKTHRRLFGKLK